jgi:hypothetical protein
MPWVLLAMLLVVALLCAASYAMGFMMSKRGQPLRERLEIRLRHRVPLQPTGRPIETIAVDLRRCSARFHGLDPHASFAKVEAVRGAYDRTLAECCAALGLAQLLDVLPAGRELDAERERVEALLADRGVRLPHAA